MSATTDRRPGLASTARSPRLALLLLCAAQLMLVVDITAVNIALPTLSRELGITGGDSTWVVTSYVIAFGGLMLLGGRLADVMGRRRMLIIGLVVFTAASLACGLADSGAQLIAARAVQGGGAALMSPAALATVNGLFTGAARVRALGVWAGVGAAGFVGGLIVSGLLTDGPGWRWVFLINLPVCLVLLVALPALVPSAVRRERAPIDVLGAVLATATVGLLVFGLNRLGAERGSLVAAGVPLLLAVTTAVVLVVVESRHRSPMLAPRVFRQGPVITGLGVMLAGSAAMLSIFFLASMYSQHVLGLDPFETGLLFVPSAAVTMLAAHGAAAVINRRGIRAVVVTAFLTTAIGAALLTQVSATSSAWGHVVPALVLTSLGLGPTVVVATSSTLARVSDEDAGVASGIVNIGHELGGAFGLAILSATIGAGLSAPSPAGYGQGFLGVSIGAVIAAVICAAAVPSVRPGAEHLRHGH